MSSDEEREYIREKLIPELLERMDGWGAEYRQPRELGVRGEFVGLHRKTGKLKTILWDGVDPSGWREEPRTILMEVIAHGLLMLHDMDHGQGFTLQENDNPLEVTPEMEEAYRRARHLSLPQTPDHTYAQEPDVIVPHLAHPGISCAVWENMRGRHGKG
jgi:hypothetical protein